MKENLLVIFQNGSKKEERFKETLCKSTEEYFNTYENYVKIIL